MSRLNLKKKDFLIHFESSYNKAGYSAENGIDMDLETWSMTLLKNFAREGTAEQMDTHQVEPTTEKFLASRAIDGISNGQ